MFKSIQNIKGFINKSTKGCSIVEESHLNIFEAMSIELIYNGLLGDVFKGMILSFLQIFQKIAVFLISVLAFVFFPIILVIKAHRRIKRGKNFAKRMGL